jgi:hypothetical protein
MNIRSRFITKFSNLALVVFGKKTLSSQRIFHKGHKEHCPVFFVSSSCSLWFFTKKALWVQSEMKIRSRFITKFSNYQIFKLPNYQIKKPASHNALQVKMKKELK